MSVYNDAAPVRGGCVGIADAFNMFSLRAQRVSLYSS
jgi:hypothetical protein